MSRPNQVAASVTAMLKHQSAYGSFVASPDSGQYQFCWLRDSSFIALALDAAGERAAADRYHRWVAGALAPLRPAMADAAALADRPGVSRRLPPARFALDGSTVRDDWPNFQTDGYGAWIWSLREHAPPAITPGDRWTWTARTSPSWPSWRPRSRPRWLASTRSTGCRRAYR